jgi:hypothetical protein
MIQNNDLTDALITGGSVILASIILTLGAFTFAWMVLERRRLKERYMEACEDNSFLLAVEEVHCQKLNDATGEGHRMRIRNQVRTETGLSLSMKHAIGKPR